MDTTVLLTLRCTLCALIVLPVFVRTHCLACLCALIVLPVQAQLLEAELNMMDKLYDEVSVTMNVSLNTQRAHQTWVINGMNIIYHFDVTT